MSRVAIFDAGSGKLKKSFAAANVSRAYLTPDQKLIVTISHDDPSIRVWAAAAPGQARKLVVNRSPIRAIALSADSKLLAASSEDQSLRLWDLTSRKLLHEQTAQAGISHLAFSPDGTKTAVVSEKTLEVWDRQTWSRAAMTAGTSPLCRQIRCSSRASSAWSWWAPTRTSDAVRAELGTGA